MKVAIDAFGITDRGKVRESNQDNFLIVEINKSVNLLHCSLAPETIAGRFGSAGGYLFVVADGVGGGPEGERASEDAITALLKYVGETVGCFNASTTTKEHELFAKLEQTVAEVHESLVETSGPGGQGPATTLTMVLLIWPRAYLVHVGDSRAYVRRNGKVQQLTSDQTFGEYMVTLGAWTEEQAAQSRPGATLTSAVGGSQFQPVVGLIDLEPGNSLMLCTDGLSKHVPDDRLASVLAESKSAEEACRTLLADALAGGGTDNISVIVVRTS
ncbi:MAG TPA: protein phosphatase 2C domain-containing protein [Gemmatimonadaceae bacterium]|nr:protein phosphatase 2C domain-containing protein [Gemmatimonadaceae bacterium]